MITRALYAVVSADGDNLTIALRSDPPEVGGAAKWQVVFQIPGGGKGAGPMIVQTLASLAEQITSEYAAKAAGVADQIEKIQNQGREEIPY